MSEGPAPVADNPTDAPEPTPEPSTTTWRDGLDPDLRNSPSLAKFNDVGALAKSYLHAEEKIGKKGVILPGENATDEERGEFWNALGRPETAEGYDLEGFEKPETLVDGWDEAFQSNMISDMHELGLTNEQARGLLERYATRQDESVRGLLDASARAADEAEASLRKEWGTAFDAKEDVAKRAFKQAFGDRYENIAGLMLQGGGLLGDHPEIVRAFAGLGEKMAEHELLGDKSPTSYSRTPDDAQREINKLQSDKGFQTALQDKGHVEHEDALRKWNNLFEQAFPNERAERRVRVDEG